ncbi:hypothetical protein T02_6574 [Trichinella nativa]|uniref:Uncharacterized protein n=1 Tax=Trichinella nativa TaxID=6335 RepID=A0A0V1KXB5_9BILA|nr:hypothetical protein T02_6574 [Trichinella nativa]
MDAGRNHILMHLFIESCEEEGSNLKCHTGLEKKCFLWLQGEIDGFHLLCTITLNDDYFELELIKLNTDANEPFSVVEKKIQALTTRDGI